MSHTHCAGNKRGHSWRKPVASDVKRPDVPIATLYTLRVCAKCGALGEVTNQGTIVVLQTAGVF